MSLPNFRIRASAAGSIMAGTVGASTAQLSNIAKMEEREKPMTKTQQEKYDKDILARDNPELPKGVKTYCQNWIKEQVYKRRKEFTSKYTDKGNFTEEWSIEWINKKRLTKHVKNEQNFTNEWMTGTPDLITKETVIDVKNSYDFSTFPLFDNGIMNKDYYYQLMVYMELTGLEWSELIYTLNDLPHHLIENEARSVAWREGGGWEDHFEGCRDHYTYKDIDDKYKIKCFMLQQDKSIIDKIKERVKLCRIYINELNERMK